MTAPATQTWFTSDWHFGHRNVLNFGPGRPFRTIEEHDETLIANHNQLVAPEDDVWVLGDVALGHIANSLRCCARMNGRKHLLCGNHDRPRQNQHRQHKANEWAHRYMREGGFRAVSIRDHLPARLTDGSPITISHYPYAGESDPNRPDRFAARRPADDGGWLLHGHVHHHWRVNGRQINVGVDAWDYAPVAETSICRMIAGAQP